MPEKEEDLNLPQNNLYLNTAIGFLSILLFFLLAALATRVVYPRVLNKRAATSSDLIGPVIQLEVLNGCGEPGIANNFTGILRKNGFDVVETGNFETFDVEKTMIISRTLSTDNARRVAAALGVAEENIISEVSPDFYLDVTVVLGWDYLNLNTN